MIRYFADTSAIAKRYLLDEIGHQWIANEARRSSRNRIIIAEITLAEMTSVITRRQREKALSVSNAEQVLRLFLAHARVNYQVINVDSLRIERARQLIRKYGLRALDASQLSCAIKAKSVLRNVIIFVSSDNNLLNAAAAEGFSDDNLLLHP